MIPPVVECGHSQNGEVIPNHRIGIFLLCVGWSLLKSEDVDPGTAFLRGVQDRLRVVEEQKIFRTDARQTQQPSVDFDLSVKEPHGRVHVSGRKWSLPRTHQY